MNAETVLMSNAKLMLAIAEAVKTAMAEGLDQAACIAALTRSAELLEEAG